MSSTSSFSPTVATLHVAIGGAVGAVLRYQLGRAMTVWLGGPAMSIFPWATLAVNALGSLLMGMLAGWLVRHGAVGSGQGSEQLRLLLGVGLLGGFTTFSAFSLEMVLLIERGQFALAGLYAILSFALGISALLFGLTVMRSFA
ncbi:camphor resistance protein CrcB [Erythrobacter sp. HI0063]|jgi:CrcB protein|uniref:fluoride efflux transporter FluC n=1 Tax=unclassified Erythrobacter TaxID=2633097 RepID=UPI0007C347C2|nr:MULTISPECIES: CrcB family protein [unclassified Erythrobacter]KZY55623.1 camphor resistance protein CrcB [Erythrobacter sp. HI0063]MBO9511328.1 CrcB family protein [Erythrobacter sp. A6_0]